MSPEKTFTREEVAKHNTEDSVWFIVDSKVYDVTDFLDAHPGGEAVLRQVAGKDATRVGFMTAMHGGSIYSAPAHGTHRNNRTTTGLLQPPPARGAVPVREPRGGDGRRRAAAGHHAAARRPLSRAVRGAALADTVVPLALLLGLSPAAAEGDARVH